jgi:hypothetical protein
MRANWDDPFSELEVFDPVRKVKQWAYRNAAGLIVGQNTVDVDRVKDAQRKLLPHFQVLRELAEEMMDDADPVSLYMSKLEVFSRTTYRFPDQPNLLQTIQLQTTSHTVILTNTGEKAHPLVESIFPVKPFSTLSNGEQHALKALVQIKMRRGKFNPSDIPRYIRVVLPAAIDLITTWIEKNDGPIHAFHYFVRPPDRSDTRHVLYDRVIN